jgi:glyoxylase-like metal-dependent hydrolase (beta-lactamase superfamily II)
MDKGYSARQLAKDLWTIEEGMVRCFLILGEQDALLVDACASGGDDFMETVESLTGNRSLKYVITHGDRDHVAGFPKDGAIMMHPAEYVRFRQGNEAAQQVIPIWDQDHLRVGKRDLEVLLLPGHTPGNIALLDQENGDIFIGDSVAKGSGVFMFGEGRFLEAYIASLMRLEEKSKNFKRLYGCHGDTEVAISQIGIQREGAVKLLAGELEPMQPPFDMPCKLYQYQSAAYLF